MLEIALVLLIVVAVVIAFASEKLPPDLIAMLALVAVAVLGLVTPAEALTGFSSSATVTVAAMFVLSAGLQRTGALQTLGAWLIHAGRNETLMLLAVMVPVGLVSAFINNTAAVAVFLPLVVAAAAARSLPASRFLIPLSFASQFGGVCTLIGTSTNLLVDAIARREGLPGFSLFEFGQLGLLMVAAGIAYFLLIGRFLLPKHTAFLNQVPELGEYVTEVRVRDESKLADKSVKEVVEVLGRGFAVLKILRGTDEIWPLLSEEIRAGDVLLLRGSMQKLLDERESLGVEMEAEFTLGRERFKGRLPLPPDEGGDEERDEDGKKKERKARESEDEAHIAEVMVPAQSPLRGRRLGQIGFRNEFNALVLAVQRHGESIRNQLNDVPLKTGDVLLLVARKKDLERMRRNQEFVWLSNVDRPYTLRGPASMALAIVAAVVLLAAFEVLPILVSALAGCAALVLTRCLTMEEAYEAVDWRVVLLLAGILPLGIAMEKSGAAALIVQYTMQTLGDASPRIFVAVFYLLTAVLTEMISNNAAAVLMAPIAISTATALGADAKPFLVAIAFAASTSFATPIGYQTNTMVYNAGEYRFADFLKVGVPLNLIFWLIATAAIPVLFPF